MNTSKQINAMIVLLSLLLVLVGVYTIWDPFRADDEDARTKEKIAERAANTFARNCRICHGNDGEGRIGPALNPAVRGANPALANFADPQKLTENRTLVQNTIACGRLGTFMPPWAQANGGALSDEQIRQLVILITENPGGNAWDKVKELSAETDRTTFESMSLPDLVKTALAAGRSVPGGLTKEDLVNRLMEAGVTTLPEVTDVTKGASTTGATTPVCGQLVKAAPTPTPTPPPPSTTLTVTTTDNKFNVNALAVPANQQVSLTITNNGQAAHNFSVTISGQKVETKLVTGGQSDTVRFTAAQPGAYDFQCTVHPQDMKGILFVQ